MPVILPFNKMAKRMKKRDNDDEWERNEVKEYYDKDYEVKEV